MSLTFRKGNTHRTSDRWRRARGFTLIELVLVMFIVGIVGAMAVPRFVGFLGNARANAAITRIKSDLAAARLRAKQTGQHQTIVFDTARNEYQIAGWESLKRSADSYTVNLAADPYQATLVTADFDGSATLVFDGWGQPVSESDNPIASGTITISAAGQTRSLGIKNTTIADGLTLPEITIK